jgi:predicted dehydrogenase
MKVRMGVLGGGFGQSLPWHEHPQCQVTAVCDLRAERRDALKKAYRCENALAKFEDMLREVDAVAVFSPATMHARHAIAALRAGKHVVSAVPAVVSLEEADALRAIVRSSGLTYMMAETSYYTQPMISARKFYKEGAFGRIFYCQADYHHYGLEELMFENGKPTWRHGFPPMMYPTHVTAFLVGLTGERLVEVSCHGWGNDSAVLKRNAYNNPFWNETAMFKTDRGTAFRASVWWEGASSYCERAEWYGEKMSFLMGEPSRIIKRGKRAVDYKQPQWWKTSMLPKRLRHDSGHDGSHPFLVHEFIESIVQRRRPAIDIEEALAYTVPGIVAHQSALRGGELLKIPEVWNESSRVPAGVGRRLG